MAGTRSRTPAVRTADADPQAQEVLCTQRLRERAQTVMAGEAAAGPSLQAPGFEIDVIMDDEHRLGLDLEEATRGGYRATRVVHERLGLEQREPQPVEPNLGELAGELRAPAAVEPSRELVHHHPADVVAVALVLAPGVSQPDDEQVEGGAAFLRVRERSDARN